MKKNGLALRITCMILAGIMVASALYTSIYYIFFA